MSDGNFRCQEISFTFKEPRKGIDISTLPKPTWLNEIDQASTFLFVRCPTIDGQAAHLGILANDVIRCINGIDVCSLPGESDER